MKTNENFNKQAFDELSECSLERDILLYCKDHSLIAQTPSCMCLKQTESTNDLAKELIKSGKKNFLITAESQTAGRGRMGRSFYSPERTGAYFTLSLHGYYPFDFATSFTSLAAVAVCRAIYNLTGLQSKIKWVNDVYLHHKKICGILTEGITDTEQGNISDVIIGVGINLTTDSFPENITIAGSIGDKKLSRSSMIAGVTAEILSEIPYISQKRYIRYYREHSMVIGNEVDYFINGEKFSGIAVDIDQNGGLIVKGENDITATLSTGEITLRLKG